MQEEQYQKLRTIVETYLPDDVDPKEIKKESDFIQELNINSANLVDIVLDVEDEFDIMLENDDMDGMKTIDDALQIIERKLADKK